MQLVEGRALFRSPSILYFLPSAKLTLAQQAFIRKTEEALLADNQVVE